MNITIKRNVDGWITISSCGKSMNVRLTRDEFYSDMNIKVISSEPNELNQYNDIEIGNTTISFNDKHKAVRKEIQKRKKRNERLIDIKHEALAILTNYLIKNENISYQVLYTKANKREQQWWKYTKYTDDRINRIVRETFEKDFSHISDKNSIDLSPTKRKDKIFINKDVIKEKAKNVEKILLSDGAIFKNNTGKIYYNEEDSKNINPKILKEINKNDEYTTTEQGKYQTNKYWF